MVKCETGMAGPRGFEPRFFGSGGLRTAFLRQFDALIQAGLRAPTIIKIAVLMVFRRLLVCWFVQFLEFCVCQL